MSTATAKAEARAIMVGVASLGNEIVSFRGGAGLVTTIGYIERVDDFFDGDATIVDARYVASLLVADVGEIHRGDRVIDEDGAEWTLLEEQANGDGFVTDWTCEARS